MKNRYPFANLRDNQSLVQGTAPKEANISIRLFISSSFFPKSCSQSNSQGRSKSNSQGYIAYHNSKHQTERHAKGKSNRHCILFFILVLAFFLFSIALNVFVSLIEPFLKRENISKIAITMTIRIAIICKDTGLVITLNLPFYYKNNLKSRKKILNESVI